MVRKRFEFPRRIGASSLQDLDMVEAVSLRGVEVVYLEPTYAAARSVNRPQRRGYLSRPIRAAGLRKEAGENGDNCEAQHLTYAAAQTRPELLCSLPKLFYPNPSTPSDAQRNRPPQTLGASPHGRHRRVPNNRSPRANGPSHHQTSLDVGVFGAEFARRCISFALKEEYRTIHRIGQRTCQDEFAAPLRLPCQPQVLSSILRPPLEVIWYKLVEQQKVHSAS